jgi:hypothetical protein
MLDSFLVLGQIPGTNIQITFSEILLVALIANLFLYRHLEQRSAEAKIQAIQLGKMHGFSYPIGLNPLVGPTQRKVVALPANIFFRRLGQAFSLVRPVA